MERRIMKITKIGEVLIKKHEIIVSKFSFDCEGEPYKKAEKLAKEWAIKRLNEKIK